MLDLLHEPIDPYLLARLLLAAAGQRPWNCDCRPGEHCACQYHIHGLYADVNGIRVDEGGAEIHLAVAVSHTKGV